MYTPNVALVTSVSLALNIMHLEPPNQVSGNAREPWLGITGEYMGMKKYHGHYK